MFVRLSIFSHSFSSLDKSYLARLAPIIDRNVYDWATCDTLCGKVLKLMIIEDQKRLKNERMCRPSGVANAIAEWRLAQVPFSSSALLSSLLPFHHLHLLLHQHRLLLVLLQEEEGQTLEREREGGERELCLNRNKEILNNQSLVPYSSPCRPFSLQNPWRQRAACVSFVGVARFGEFNELILTIASECIKNDYRFVQLGTGIEQICSLSDARVCVCVCVCVCVRERERVYVRIVERESTGA